MVKQVKKAYRPCGRNEDIHLLGVAVDNMIYNCLDELEAARKINPGTTDTNIPKKFFAPQEKKLIEIKYYVKQVGWLINQNKDNCKLLKLTYNKLERLYDDYTPASLGIKSNDSYVKSTQFRWFMLCYRRYLYSLGFDVWVFS